MPFEHCKNIERSRVKFVRCRLNVAEVAKSKTAILRFPHPSLPMNKKLPLQWGIHLTTFLQGFLNNFSLLVDSTCGVSVLWWQANAPWNNRKNLSEMQVIPYFLRGRQSLSFHPSMFRACAKCSPVNVARKFPFPGLQTRRTHTWSLWVRLGHESLLSLPVSFRANWQWCFTYIFRVPKVLLESWDPQGLRERR